MQKSNPMSKDTISNVYIPFYWTCSWCGITEQDKAGRFVKGRIFHYGCYEDYLDSWIREEEEGYA